jgi:hypothetical protein
MVFILLLFNSLLPAIQRLPISNVDPLPLLWI